MTLDCFQESDTFSLPGSRFCTSMCHRLLLRLLRRSAGYCGRRRAHRERIMEFLSQPSWWLVFRCVALPRRKSHSHCDLDPEGSCDVWWHHCILASGGMDAAESATEGDLWFWQAGGTARYGLLFSFPPPESGPPFQTVSNYDILENFLVSYHFFQACLHYSSAQSHL